MRVAATMVLSLVLGSTALAAEVFAPQTTDQAKAATRQWLATRQISDSALLGQLDTLWQFPSAEPTPAERFDAVMQTFYSVDPDVRQLVDACRGLAPRFWMNDFAAIASHRNDPFYSQNVRYFYARYLTVLTLYEEALDLFNEIEPEQVVDPAGCLFFKAVCEHSLLQKDEGLKTIALLTGSTQDVPARYTQVAELMKLDLEGLKEKSLSEVARQMDDVERRLALGRAGEKVQRVEEKIISTLDEIIKKLEEQQGGGGGGAGNAGNAAPSNPADESYVGGIKGPGEVDPKKAGHKDNWGNLPPKAQATAKNMLDRQFPPHYRQAVEEYLKKLADRQAPSR
ncbi:hypothetical protein [Planctomyces sp. SH-PL14]|uniref:hypothetical protein n=1 Tax=Planctomyces sp. SH-PL14 TaxID=1632864 RepID=UPI00078BCFB0|nr:hypothetical protein [Planctomyces sp. SH-PL14]AMV21715.1 hypothetical protein VT03_27690 [Planctomyces sp. SH-PL14]